MGALHVVDGDEVHSLLEKQLEDYHRQGGHVHALKGLGPSQLASFLVTAIESKGIEGYSQWPFNRDLVLCR